MLQRESKQSGSADAYQEVLKKKFNEAFEKSKSISKNGENKKGASKIAQIGILHILNQMKNPLTNIMLCLEMIESKHQETDGKDCHEIIKSSSKALETSVRDLIKSFNDLGISVHLKEDNSEI